MSGNINIQKLEPQVDQFHPDTIGTRGRVDPLTSPTQPLCQTSKAASDYNA